MRGATLAWQIFQPVRVWLPSLFHEMAPWGVSPSRVQRWLP